LQTANVKNETRQWFILFEKVAYESEKPKMRVVIVGAGPAGSSLAIRLALRGSKVTLIERDRFPREKLCGEFISPECFRHFEDLGVTSDLFAKGGKFITGTRFFSASGKSVSVPTAWFGHGDVALSLSRAEMDLALLDRARDLGVEVLEGYRVNGVEMAHGRVESITVNASNGTKGSVGGELFVDAAGRSAILTKLSDRVSKNAPEPARGARLIAFKNHLYGARSDAETCEIYFFDGGYGGLSPIQDDLYNYCCIVTIDKARDFIGKTNNCLEMAVGGNQRAKQTLSDVVTAGEWLAVPVTGFGRRRPAAIPNLVAVGDAAAFIDPFTGSGMLMALESSKLLAETIDVNDVDHGRLSQEYDRLHELKFHRRLTVTSILRQAAFSPKLASAAIMGANVSSGFTEFLARTTRFGSRDTSSAR